MNRPRMTERFIGLVFREGHFVIKKMFSFRNIQICVDGPLMFNAALYMYNPTCREFKIGQNYLVLGGGGAVI